MDEIYSKQGRLFRVEIDARQKVAFHIRESGAAALEGELFRCWPTEPAISLPEPAEGQLLEIVAAIERSVHPPLVIERMIATTGTSEHAFSSGADQTHWRETASRIHLSIAHPDARLRVLFDSGGSWMTDVDLAPLQQIVDALCRALPQPSRTMRSAVRLDPLVAAALWPTLLLALSAGSAQRAPISFSQEGNAAVAFDGRGQPVREGPLEPGRGGSRWPNVYRPSYRVRPVPLPLNIRAAATATADEPPPAIDAVALLEPVRRSHRIISLAVLCHDCESGSAFPASISMDAARWCQSVASVSARSRWFPYLGGSFGAETALRAVALEPYRGPESSQES
jgi:hypothetical protein